MPNYARNYAGIIFAPLVGKRERKGGGDGGRKEGRGEAAGR